jgi:hypothetical protein
MHRHWPATNFSSAHRPYSSAEQSLTPVSETTTRMLSPKPSPLSTASLVSWGAEGLRGQEGRTL